MHRRSFIQKSGLSGLGLALIPSIFSFQDIEYSVLELMGKANIDLYGNGYQMRKEAQEAFEAMRKAAYGAGIDIKPVSSFRSFARQAAIFERKYERYAIEDGMKPLDAIDKIIEYSTIPGTSRHHWGTDIDLIDGSKKVSGDVLVSEKFEAGGPFEDFKLWMDENSKKFDYYLVYTDNPKRRGFKYEPWHYSYAPLSIPMLAAFRRKNILQLLEQEEFLGSEHFTTGFIKTYIQDNILDINPELL
ncbi:M15 family metallopeptidase [Poritiphilus flavus]|uniref:D-alanyl-D-alanine carboxypeptidase family protein n=1 Tax=Poritiphilus flavus TaxID=2697053 RepID=A0A6L9EHF6_9FLAO|nr:M15 family metallopeptidase [Poritiphilus flavus]NAS14115.1 D-alanyl-D-alanine carboxypeptidase family protein [Poritiphilus flavus]